MKRPARKDIKAAVDKLKESTSSPAASEPKAGKLAAKKSNLRIRKQGV